MAIIDAPCGQMHHPDYQIWRPSCHGAHCASPAFLVPSMWPCNAGACLSSEHDSNVTEHASVLAPGQQLLCHVLPGRLVLCSQCPAWQHCTSFQSHHNQQTQLKSSCILALLLSFLLVLQSKNKNNIAVQQHAACCPALPVGIALGSHNIQSPARLCPQRQQATLSICSGVYVQSSHGCLSLSDQHRSSYAE